MPRARSRLEPVCVTRNPDGTLVGTGDGSCSPARTHARTHARAHVHSLILHVFFHDAHRAFSWGQYVFKAERERGGGGAEGAIANERET